MSSLRSCRARSSKRSSISLTFLTFGTPNSIWDWSHFPGIPCSPPQAFSICLPMGTSVSIQCNKQFSSLILYINIAIIILLCMHECGIERKHAIWLTINIISLSNLEHRYYILQRLRTSMDIISLIIHCTNNDSMH